MFGERLRLIRKKKGYSYNYLSKISHIPATTISGWENAKQTPNVYLAIDAANALGCSVYELCGKPSMERERAIDEVCELLNQLMVHGEFEIFIDTKIAEEIISIVRRLKYDTRKQSDNASD